MYQNYIFPVLQLPEPPNRDQSLTLKLETATLKTSDMGKNPDCAAGSKPGPTAEALSLKGLIKMGS
jgi:hypothetical protein